MSLAAGRRRDGCAVRMRSADIDFRSDAVIAPRNIRKPSVGHVQPVDNLVAEWARSLNNSSAHSIQVLHHKQGPTRRGVPRRVAKDDQVTPTYREALMNTKLKFAFEKETKGAVRYQEVGEDGAPAFAPQVGTLYVRKSAMPSGKIPKTLVVTITGE